MSSLLRFHFSFMSFYSVFICPSCSFNSVFICPSCKFYSIFICPSCHFYFVFICPSCSLLFFCLAFMPYLSFLLYTFSYYCSSVFPFFFIAILLPFLPFIIPFFFSCLSYNSFLLSFLWCLAGTGLFFFTSCSFFVILNIIFLLPIPLLFSFQYSYYLYSSFPVMDNTLTFLYFFLSWADTFE